MALKRYELTDGLAVTVYKRRSSRSIRLSIAANGEVRVSLPLWLPYKAGLAFANTRLDWIHRQRPAKGLFVAGHEIGKQHRLQFMITVKGLKITSRLTADKVVITHPLALANYDPNVQAAVERAAIRALRAEATLLLPPRLKSLALQHNFRYIDVSIKQLTGRWGSCDQHQRIALNLFLMQLPWELIDYVLLHELVHTKFLHHGEDFWNALEAILPGAKKLRIDIHKHKPVVMR